MHKPDFNYRELIKITIGLAVAVVSTTAIYFALYLLTYFTIMNTSSSAQNLATGQLGTLLLLYFPAYLSSTVSSWMMLRRSKPNKGWILLRLIAVLCTCFVIVGAILLLPGLHWAWINLVVTTIFFFLGVLTTCAIRKSFE